MLVSVGGAPPPTRRGPRGRPAHQPGEEVTLVVRRYGTEQHPHDATGGADGTAIIGVLLRTDYELPGHVTLNTGRVGARPPGLMFTLAIYDVLTPGSLTGGQRIAGTGTIGRRWRGRPDQRHPPEDGRRAPGRRALVPLARQRLRRRRRPRPGRDDAPQGDDFDAARTAVEGIAKGDTAGLPPCG